MYKLYNLSRMFQKLANNKRYWGVKCSGLLLICKEDNTMFLAKRSSKVEQGGTWGIPGGAIDIYTDELEQNNEELIGYPEFFYYPDIDDNSYPEPPDNVFLESALREASEEFEVSIHPSHLLQTIDYKDKEFTYKTFVFNISLKDKNELSKSMNLNWEHDEFKWFKLNKKPGNLHPGLKFVLNNLSI